MSLSQFNFSAQKVQDLFQWFNDIQNHLNDKNYVSRDWNPIFSGISGSKVFNATHVSSVLGVITNGSVSSLISDNSFEDRFLLEGESDYFVIEGTDDPFIMEDPNALTFTDNGSNSNCSIQIDFSGVQYGDYTYSVDLTMYHNGTSNSKIKIKVYNYITELWENISSDVNDIAFGLSYTHKHFQLSSPIDNYISSGVISARVVDESTIDKINYMRIDSAVLSSGYPEVVGSGAWYHRWGQLVNFSIEIANATSTTGMVISGLPFVSIGKGCGEIINTTDNEMVGTCIIDGTDIHMSDIAVSNKDVIIKGSYRTSGI
jgi:hypothetical protein